MSPTFPLYQCHKQVRAAEITGVYPGTRRITIALGSGLECVQHQIMVEDSWMDRFQPQPGMWLVEYADGYRSVSPASAFVSGYTAIDEDKADDEWKPKPEGQTEQQATGNATAPSSGISYGGGQG